jgi:hypothetical protein
MKTLEEPNTLTPLMSDKVYSIGAAPNHGLQTNLCLCPHRASQHSAARPANPIRQNEAATERTIQIMQLLRQPQSQWPRMGRPAGHHQAHRHPSPTKSDGIFSIDGHTGKAAATACSMPSRTLRNSARCCTQCSPLRHAKIAAVAHPKAAYPRTFACANQYGTRPGSPYVRHRSNTQPVAAICGSDRRPPQERS